MASNSSSASHITSTIDVAISIESNMNRLFFINNDIPSLILVTKKLIGSDNYRSWRRSMEISLSAKNKLCLLDGTYAEPKAGTKLHLLWKRANDIIISWIFNSVSDEIGNSLGYVKTAKAVRQQLHHRFSHLNSHRIFQLERDLHSLEQGNSSVEIYYHRMKGLWVEIAALDVSAACTCLCTCGVGRDNAQREDRKQVMQFLMGLSDSFIRVRGQILRMDPLPTLDQAFNIVKY